MFFLRCDAPDTWGRPQVWLRPSEGLIARTRILKLGKTLAFTACKLYAVQNGEEKLVATGVNLLTPVADAG